jgi:hypothetical protein
MLSNISQMTPNHAYDVIGAGLVSINTLLQIDGVTTFSQFFEFERVGMIGLMAMAVWYFKGQIEKQKKEFDEKLTRLELENERLFKENTELKIQLAKHDTRNN